MIHRVYPKSHVEILEFFYLRFSTYLWISHFSAEQRSTCRNVKMLCSQKIKILKLVNISNYVFRVKIESTRKL